MKPMYVEFIPRELDDGILYISKQFKTASHLCCCGCGTKIVTPLRPTEFTLTGSADAVSLYPSIGNWNFPCQSHYWIKSGRVVVADKMTREEILRGRQFDDAQKAAYFANREPWWRHAVRSLFGFFAKSRN
jgi:hypothetical protein